MASSERDTRPAQSTSSTAPSSTAPARSSTAPGHLSVGSEVELDITGIAHGGICVARHEGRVVFVADAIPGERVRARITEARKKTFARAVTTEVLEVSPDRREHVWPEAALERDPALRAGGAEFGHIALPRQRELKAEVLIDAMSRFGGVDITDELGTDPGTLIEPCPGDDEANGLGYRTRVRLHVDPDTGAVGPYAARSRSVIPVTSLPLATSSIEQIAPVDELMPDVTVVDLVDPSGDDARMLLTLSGEKQRSGEADSVIELVEDRAFRVRASGFWQVHRAAPATLFTAVREAVEFLISKGRFDAGAANLDLYGGAGLLAAALAEAAGARVKITTVEADPGATDDAAENLSQVVGARALTARVDRYLADQLAASAPVRDRLSRATVVLDPPRSGAGGDVCARLAEIAPANIIYVACDPVALARDTKTLLGAGYDLMAVRAFDLFPHTHHFESIALFERA